MPVNLSSLKNQWYDQKQVDKDGNGKINRQEIADYTNQASTKSKDQQSMEEALGGKLIHSKDDSSSESFFDAVSKLDGEADLSKKDFDLLSAKDGNSEELAGADFDKMSEKEKAVSPKSNKGGASASASASAGNGAASASASASAGGVDDEEEVEDAKDADNKQQATNTQNNQDLGNIGNILKAILPLLAQQNPTAQQQPAYQPYQQPQAYQPYQQPQAFQPQAYQPQAFQPQNNQFQPQNGMQQPQNNQINMQAIIPLFMQIIQVLFQSLLQNNQQATMQ